MMMFSRVGVTSSSWIYKSLVELKFKLVQMVFFWTVELANMQVATSIFVSLMVLSSTVESRTSPLTKFNEENYAYSNAIMDAQTPSYLQIAAYQDSYSPYRLYNVLQIQADLTALPTAILGDISKPMMSHVPTYNYFYAPPIYDYRFPLNTIYPVLRPQYPGLIPKPPTPPITTSRPFDVGGASDDDGIEKLDSKLEPIKEIKKPEDAHGDLSDENDDDTITIDAI